MESERPHTLQHTQEVLCFVEYDNIYEERDMWRNPRLLLLGSRNIYPNLGGCVFLK